MKTALVSFFTCACDSYFSGTLLLINPLAHPAGKGYETSSGRLSPPHFPALGRFPPGRLFLFP